MKGATLTVSADPASTRIGMLHHIPVRLVALLGLLAATACWEGGTTAPVTPAPAPDLVTDTEGPAVLQDGFAAARKASAAPAALASPMRSASTGALRISASVASTGLSAALGAVSAADAPMAKAIPFAPEPGLAANLGPACDDCVMTDVPIGFTFTYFGKQYSALDISSNGFVRFGNVDPDYRENSGCCAGGLIPLDEGTDSGLYGQNNLIAIAWSDWMADQEGRIRYETRGAAPNRRFVLQFVDVPECCEDTPTASRVTAQLILFEGSSAIELHTSSLTPLSAYGFTRSITQGVEDAAGAVAAYVPGRVQAPLRLTNDAVRFTTGSVNQPPVASVGGPYAASEGLGVVLSAAASTDPEGGALSYAWDLDEDGQFDDATGVSASWVYPDEGTYRVAVRVTDAQGAAAAATGVANVVNVTPAPELGASLATSEGTPVSATRTFTDPGADSWTATVDYGDGSGAQPLTLSGGSFTLAHTYADNGSYAIQVSITDNDGATGTGTLPVVVGNVAPTVTGFSVPAELRLGPGGAIAPVLGVQFTDPAFAVDGPFTTAIACGNGRTADEAGRCTYTRVGSYDVTVTVADKDGGVSAPLTRSVHVGYDFSGFFQPVENLPFRNLVRAGTGVPVRFSLGGDYGFDIFAEGFPTAMITSCDPALQIERVGRRVRTTLSELTYSSQRAEYTYVWKTEKEWAGSCRLLVVRLNDGTERQALFEFK